MNAITSTQAALMPRQLDMTNIYVCLERTVSSLVNHGTLAKRFDNLKIMATGWIFGLRHDFDEEQNQIYLKIIALMKEGGHEDGHYREMSESEQQECAQLWLALLLSAATRLPK